MARRVRRIADKDLPPEVRRPRRPGKKPKAGTPTAPPESAPATPKKTKPAQRRIHAAEPSEQPDSQLGKRRVLPRDPQRELKVMPPAGVIYGTTCQRCDQPVRVNIKATEGDFVLMNYYTAKCLCGGLLSMSLISDISLGPVTFPNNTARK